MNHRRRRPRRTPRYLGACHSKRGGDDAMRYSHSYHRQRGDWRRGRS